MEIVGPMAAAVISALALPRVFSIISKFEHLPKDVEKIKNNCKWMEATVYQIEEMECTSEAKIWASQVRKVFDNALDVIYKIDCLLKRPQCPSYDLIFKNIGEWNEIGNEIKDIRKTFDDLLTKRNGLGLGNHNPIDSLASNSADPALFLPWTDNSRIFGYQKAKEWLISKLVEGDKRLQVIRVWGMGGVGKSTLLSKIYDEIKEKFAHHIWINIGSSVMNLGQIVRRMISYFELDTGTLTFDGEFGLDKSITVLQKFLLDKKYIAIIDDVWEEDHWQKLRHVFSDNDLQSRVVLTTRFQGIATSGASDVEDNIIELGGLGDEEGLDLLLNRAGRPERTSSDFSPSLQNVGQKILPFCGKLPLAIVILGSQLASVPQNVREWEATCENFLKNLGRGEINRVLFSRIYLKLSFQQGSLHYRSCLLYFGMYPLSYKIKTADLIRQWIDEGFIIPRQSTNESFMSSRTCLYQDADEILTGLATMSLIEVVRFDCLRRAKVCRVHQMIYYPIREKSNEENFSTQPRAGNTCRRLVIFPGRSDDTFCSFDPSKFRSLFVFGSNVLPRLEKFTSKLRVLCIFDVQRDSFPSAIFDLKWLRHLSFRNNNITSVPAAIKNLKYLRTLDLKNTCISELPKEILKLKSLSNLLVYDPRREQGVALPRKLRKLIALEKLLLVNVENADFFFFFFF